LSFTIHDLRDEPDHLATVTDRIWRAWWEPYGSSLADLEQGLAEVAAAKDYPSFTLVALERGRFLGTVTGIEDDIEARPELGPCIAALWVEEAERHRGIGKALINAACTRFAASGFSQAYLAAKPLLRSYYCGLGWTHIESAVGDDNLDLFRRTLT
jgi:predicted N-acetyltransferase YhbS